MKLPILLFLGIALTLPAFSQKLPSKSKSVYYKLKVYHLKDSSQIAHISDFLKDKYLPAAHKLGQKQIGVFLEKSAQFGTNIYLFNPIASLEELNRFDADLLKDKAYAAALPDLNKYDGKNPFYQRIETMLLDAFPKMKYVKAPALKAAKADRVYELRSYESPTEELGLNKVDMFNEGNEVALFEKLGFNAVFYSRVVVGSRMPNLMYMISFENMADHDAKWNSFKDAPEWKKLSALPQYQNNVNKIDAHFLTPMEYSDL